MPPGSPGYFRLKKMLFSTPVFRPGLFNPSPFLDLVWVELAPELKQDFLKSISNSVINFSV